MVLYEVTAEVDEPLRERYEWYMREEHIDDVLSTGCFVSAAFARSETPGRYRTTYLAASQSDLDRYLATHTAEMRARFLEHFPSGVTLAREVWTT
jgi:hypothetical protein